MAEIKGTLKHGYKVGDEVYRDYVLREANAGDVIEANEESEKLVVFPNAEGRMEPQFVPSPTMVGVHVLRRQVKVIGPISGPLPLVAMKTLHTDDMTQLQNDAEKLEQVEEIEALQAVAHRGRSDSGGEAV
jgi:phage FluMu protein gp41